MARHYPLFLDLSRAKCLLVGAGAVGRRKIDTLLEAGAGHILALDPDPAAGQGLPAHPALVFEAREFVPEDLHACALVFAASASSAVNAAVAELCAGRGIFCNCVDAPEKGTCIVPASARCGELVLALSSGGSSPAYVRRLRNELEPWLRDKAPLASLLGRLRPRVLALGQDTVQNTELFRLLACQELEQALARGDKDLCLRLLGQMLPQSLHAHITELLDGLV